MAIKSPRKMQVMQTTNPNKPNYSLANPEGAAPNPKSNEIVNFDMPNGQVQHTPLDNGKPSANPITLSRDEQRQLNEPSNNIAQMSPEVRKLFDLQKRQSLKEQVSEKMKVGATLTDVTNELINAEMLKRTPVTEQPATQMQANSVTPSTQITQPVENPEKKSFLASNPLEIGKNIAGSVKAIATGDKAALQQRNSEMPLASASDITQVPMAAIKTAAKAWEWADSIFHGGKGFKQREIEQSLSTINGDISQDISMVRLGLKDPAVVRKKLRDYESLLNKLAETNQGLGKFNMRYLVGEGVGIETQLSAGQDNLADWGSQLDNAIQTAQIAEIKSQYGLV